MVATLNRAKMRSATPGTWEMAITGDQALLEAMQEITSVMVDKIAPAGLRGYLRVLAAGMKAEIPGDLKDARRGIGWRLVKVHRQTGKAMGKAGDRVGMNRAKQYQEQQKVKQDRDPGRGLGISAYNLNWAIRGTKGRKHKSSGQSTGKMPAIIPGVILDGARRSRGKALAKFRELAAAGIKREAAKIRSKARAQVTKKISGAARRGIGKAVRAVL